MCASQVVLSREQTSARKRAKGTSIYLGVSNVPKGRRKWKAQTTYKGTHFYLGVFDSEIDAAMAFDQKVRELHGAKTHLNFPEV